MFEFIEFLLPVFFVFIYLVLQERWKEKCDLPLKQHILIVLAKITICLVSVVSLVFIFGRWLGASEIQMLPIVAIGFGCAYGLACYLLEPFYSKKS